LDVLLFTKKGIKYHNQCQFNPIIPIWLVIGGCVMTTCHSINLFFHFKALCNRSQLPYELMSNQSLTNYSLYARLITNLLIIGWLIEASFLAFPNKNVVNTFDSSNAYYCAKICFDFMYAKTIVLWCTIGIFIFMFGGALVRGCFFS
jgi:hypothetical protein